MITGNRKSRPALVILSAAFLFPALSACTEDHFARRDTITAEAGDAVAVNAAQQTRDTLPASAKRTALKHDANRLNKAMERYRNPEIEEGSGEDESEIENADDSMTRQ